MSVTVKVFFEQANDLNEIRRFPVSTAQNVDIFNETRKKIIHLFPALAHGRFKLYWQDPDGDRVAFSTSEEMRDAMAYASDGILRLYVSPPTDSKITDDQGQKQHEPSEKQQPSEKQPRDPGESRSQGSNPTSGQGPYPFNGGPAPPVVTCDACTQPIIGLLYKCCVCINYNLCQECAGKGLHSEHSMLRIPQPYFFSPPPYSQIFGFPPQPSFSFCKFGPGMPSGAYNSTSTTSKSCSSCKTDTNAGGQTGPNSNQKDGRKDNATFTENFNEFGTNISATPFGIKVSCNVNDGKGNQKQKNYQHNWWSRGPCPSWSDTPFGPQQGSTSEGLHREADDAAKKMEADSTDCTGNTQFPCKTENKAGSNQWSWTNAEEDVIKLQIPTTFAIPMPCPSSISVSVSSPQPTTVTASAPQPTAAPQPTSNSGSYVFTEVPNVGIPTNDPQNVRIQESLNMMLSMGFSDSDGSLYAHLLEHDGDIGSTIDALRVMASQLMDAQRNGR